VRLYLNRTYHEGKPISCLETLRKLLWVAEFFTEVQQGGLREVWNPGQLRHPDLPQDCYFHVEKVDLWWLAIDSDNLYRAERAGCILADGLWTEESQSCVVINLRGNHYPKLTVDRKKIVQWDRQWVHEMLLSSCESLLNWSRLTLRWLWNLSNDWSQVAGKLVDTLVTKNANVKLGRWRSDKMEVPIAKVGCFEGDAALLEYWIFSEFSISIDMPFWMLPYRILLWEQYGCSQLSASSVNSLPAWMQPDLCPVPQPEDALALSRVLIHPSRHHPRYLHSRGYENRISAAHIVLASFQLNEPVAKTLERLQRFIHLGLEVSQIDTESLGDLTATPEDLIALSNNSDKQYLSASYSLKDDRASVAYVILAAERIGESIAATLKRLQRFAPLGLEVPNVEPQFLDSLSATPEDLIAFSQMAENQVSAAQIVFVAERLSEPIVATLKRLERFAPLGLKVPDIDLEALSSLMSVRENLIAVSQGLDGRLPWLTGKIHPSRVILAALVLGEPLQNTLERLRRFAPMLGLTLPEGEPESWQLCTNETDEKTNS
jgi:hypothetical protein